MNAVERRPLPRLADERIDMMEDRLFADIAAERGIRRRRRRTGWVTAGAAAAVVAVAAVIAPSVAGIVAPVAVEESAVAPAGGDSAPLTDEAVTSEAGGGAASDSAASGPAAVDAFAGRDIITTASADLIVDDVPVAADAVADAAIAIGGYVQSQSVGSLGAPIPIEPGAGGSDISAPVPFSGDTAWVSVRVPADEVTSFVDGLREVGEVTRSSVDRVDVTDQTIDLQARVDATQASVDRLEELLAQAGDLGDLIAAESALAERQATLESYQQQLASLEDQVELASVSVSLSPRVERVTADPAGFADGVAAGWNGLIATLNGMVIAVGFLLPWLAVLGIAALLVWGIVRIRRTRRGRRARGSAEADTDTGVA
jgi:hypothetical protein